jgi:hypothetical protein
MMVNSLQGQINTIQLRLDSILNDRPEPPPEPKETHKPLQTRHTPWSVKRRELERVDLERYWRNKGAKMVGKV